MSISEFVWNENDDVDQNSSELSIDRWTINGSMLDVQEAVQVFMDTIKDPLKSSSLKAIILELIPNPGNPIFASIAADNDLIREIIQNLSTNNNCLGLLSLVLSRLLYFFQNTVDFFYSYQSHFLDLLFVDEVQDLVIGINHFHPNDFSIQAIVSFLEGHLDSRNERGIIRIVKEEIEQKEFISEEALIQLLPKFLDSVIRKNQIFKLGSLIGNYRILYEQAIEVLSNNFTKFTETEFECINYCINDFPIPLFEKLVRKFFEYHNSFFGIAITKIARKLSLTNYAKSMADFLYPFIQQSKCDCFILDLAEIIDSYIETSWWVDFRLNQLSEWRKMKEVPDFANYQFTIANYEPKIELNIGTQEERIEKPLFDFLEGFSIDDIEIPCE